jgi:N-acetylglucosamine-6-phosphate deacetylase
MSELVLRAARLHTPERSIEPAEIVVDRERGVVTALGPAGTGGVAGGNGRDGSAVVDLGERLIVPGFVDVHTHGGHGRQVNGDDPEEVAEALGEVGCFLAEHGTTSFLATTVTDTPERLLASLEGVALARGRAAGAGGARVAGAHLEGPYIARARLGAQDPTRLRMPDPDELAGLIAASEGAVRLITLAPELEGAFDLIELARSHGLAVALGHTDADFDTARRAFDAGASHVTHLFNAMAPLHHRKPGVIGAALTTDGVTLELIADLEHVHHAVLRLVAAAAPDRIVAVSDSVPAAGLGAGRHRLGAMDVTVSGRRVELTRDPATLAGSLLTLDVAVANLVSAAGLAFDAALRAATLTPGSLVERAGGPSGLGRLAPGGPADLVVLEPDLTVAATIVAGRAVHDPGRLLP